MISMKQFHNRGQLSNNLKGQRANILGIKDILVKRKFTVVSLKATHPITKVVYLSETTNACVINRWNSSYLISL